MPVKSSTYTDLTLTHERLKRETQQYLNSLEAGDDGNTAPGSATVTQAEQEQTPSLTDNSEFDLCHCISEEGHLNSDENSSDDSFSSDVSSDSSDSEDELDTDDLADQPLRQSSATSIVNDDDSLFAMAARLEDGSVISYSSFDVTSHSNQIQDGEPRLALPCSTGNNGLRAKKMYPKEGRYEKSVFESKLERLKHKLEKDLGLDGDAGVNGAAAALGGAGAKVEGAKERRRSRSRKQAEGQDSQETKPANTRSSSTPPLMNKRDEKKNRSKERKRGDRNSKGHSNSFIERSSRQKEVDYPSSVYERHARRGTEEVTAAAGGVGRKFHSPEKMTGPKISQWKDSDDEQPKKSGSKITQTKGADKAPKQNLNNSEYTLQTNNAKKNKPRKSNGKTKKKGNDESDESMHGVGTNVRMPKAPASSKAENSKHSKTPASPKSKKSKRKSKHSRSRSNSKEEKHTQRPRSRSTPPILETDETHRSSSSHTHSDDNNSSYDSDCNTEFFYESTDDEDFYSSYEDLPMVGTSVLKAVEDLNSKSIGGKVKKLFGRKSTK